MAKTALKYQDSDYIALEELDFLWYPEDVLEFDQMWNAGKGIFELAEYFGRSTDEIAVLAIDRRIKKAIKPRPQGIWGNAV